MRLPTIALLATAILLTGCVTPAREKHRRNLAAEQITATPAARAAQRPI